MASPEQELIIAHDLRRHGRILAGPGTGKSTTVLELAKKLLTLNPQAGIRIVTFTRAATAELLEKVSEGGESWIEPTTLHGFALSILRRNPGLSPLPEPLRIPDDWESRFLIHADLAARLRGQGHDVDVGKVRRLESEMAARWESLDPGLELLADLDPALRNAYVANWEWHRRVYGYSLFAEMPLYASQLVEDHDDLKLGDLDLLIVDEYQDLNRAEIALVEALAQRGVSILAVGDDDQSIYSFRMAAPDGIRTIHLSLSECRDYSLSISFRCGRSILQAARTLIESMPNRPSRPPLQPGPSNPDGEFQYLRFTDDGAERRGVARLVRHLLDNEQLDPNQIVLLLRGDANSAWSGPLRKELTAQAIPSTNVEVALVPLYERNSRLMLAVARLADDPTDSLAWWTVLRTTKGVAEPYINAVADEGFASQERFSSRLLRCVETPPANERGIP